jgi:hypothetical protein
VPPVHRPFAATGSARSRQRTVLLSVAAVLPRSLWPGTDSEGRPGVLQVDGRHFRSLVHRSLEVSYRCPWTTITSKCEKYLWQK